MNTFDCDLKPCLHVVRIWVVMIMAISALSAEMPQAGSQPKGELRLSDPKRGKDDERVVEVELTRVPRGLTGLQFDLVSV